MSIHAITLVYDEDDPEPRLDIGDVNVWTAIALLEKAASDLSFYAPPVVVMMNSVEVIPYLEDDD